MSIEPTRSSTVAGGILPPQKPKQSFFAFWADCMYKGSKMESMPCMTYCKWQWDIRDPDTFGKTQDAFFKDCLSTCDFVKKYAKWSRLN